MKEELAEADPESEFEIARGPSAGLAGRRRAALDRGHGALAEAGQVMPMRLPFEAASYGRPELPIGAGVPAVGTGGEPLPRLALDLGGAVRHQAGDQALGERLAVRSRLSALRVHGRSVFGADLGDLGRRRFG